MLKKLIPVALYLVTADVSTPALAQEGHPGIVMVGSLTSNNLVAGFMDCDTGSVYYIPESYPQVQYAVESGKAEGKSLPLYFMGEETTIVYLIVNAKVIDGPECIPPDNSKHYSGCLTDVSFGPPIDLESRPEICRPE